MLKKLINALVEIKENNEDLYFHLIIGETRIKSKVEYFSFPCDNAVEIGFEAGITTIFADDQIIEVKRYKSVCGKFREGFLILDEEGNEKAFLGVN